MAAYAGSVIDIDLVIASDDEAAIDAAMDRLAWRSVPGVADVFVSPRGFGDDYYLRMGGLLIDNSKVTVPDDRAGYERTFAEALEHELGVHVATGRDYDAGKERRPQ